jgi:serine/threonine protein kinase/Flp pilus assembly protein TadD
MGANPSEAVSREQHLDEVLFAYLRAVESGQAPDRQELLARYPELAPELTEFFAEQERFDRVVAPLRGLAQQVAGGSGGDGVAPTAAEAGVVTGVLGDFRIIREVGRGGMGVVYEAEQISLGRRVALKVLPFAATMDPRHLQRFHNEARAAASLEHPHIVPVYGVGCERGIHYYAMKFIDGQPLASLIKQQRADPASRERQRPEGPPGADTPGSPEPLTAPAAAARTQRAPRDATAFRQIAAWGIQAAEALEHAHSLGVVHRDIKPANLMIDGHGALWVTDYGLARTAADAGLTMTGDVLGTLRYMSPEQALAKHGLVDHRTDIYSLGVTLYELLTGTPAVGGKDREEILNAITLQERRPPRALDAAIPRDLETIVLKAMEKSPTDRYGMAQEMADDLERFLKDEPIRARRPALIQRARKWCRRHRAFVTAALSVLLIAVVLGSGTASWWLQKRAAAEREVELALAEAIRYQDKGQWAEGLSAARRAEGLLAGGSINAALQKRVRQRRGELEMAKRLSDIPIQIHASAGDYSRGDVASAYARAFREFGIDVTALDPGEAAERIRATSISVQLVEALDEWAGPGKTEGAKPDSQQLLAIASAVDPDPLRNRLRDILGHGDLAAMKELAASEETVPLGPGALDRLASGLDRARAHQEAVALLWRAQRAYPGDFSINEDLALGCLDMTPPRLDEAIRFFTVAVALHPENPGAHINLGSALLHGKYPHDLDAAIEEFRAAVRLAPGYLYSYNNLGAALRRKGDLDGAIRAYREALPFQPDLPVLRLNLGSALDKKGEFDEAAKELREAIRLLPGAPEGYLALGQVLRHKLQFAEAQKVYRAGLEKVRDRDGVKELAQELRECEHQAELDGKLPRILSGDAQPADNAERLDLARWCVEQRQLDLAAVGLFRAAFAQEPAAAENLDTYDRYNAACAAALAGCGRGKDADQTDDKERARLRGQGLEWLRADLAVYRRVLEKVPDNAGTIRARMERWQQDTDFAGVRGPEALAKLPEAERRDWEKLWADVADTLARAQGKTAPDRKQGSK